MHSGPFSRTRCQDIWRRFRRKSFLHTSEATSGQNHPGPGHCRRSGSHRSRTGIPPIPSARRVMPRRIAGSTRICTGRRAIWTMPGTGISGQVNWNTRARCTRSDAVFLRPSCKGTQAIFTANTIPKGATSSMRHSVCAWFRSMNPNTNCCLIPLPGTAHDSPNPIHCLSSARPPRFKRIYPRLIRPIIRQHPHPGPTCPSPEINRQGRIGPAGHPSQSANQVNPAPGSVRFRQAFLDPWKTSLYPVPNMRRTSGKSELISITLFA